ncbi:hypothetical protein SprV_0301166100 [Sparganum proliferum]
MSLREIFGGKLTRRSVTATSLVGSTSPSRLIHNFNRSSSRNFLVDTGAYISLIPPSPTDPVDAFQHVKETLADTTALSHLLTGPPISIVADASNFAIDTALQQQTPMGSQPLSYYSAKLTPLQAHYSTFGREFLAT